MKYQQPGKRTPEEILSMLTSPNTPPHARIDAVLSAIYCDESVTFSGDILIDEFLTAEYKEKIYLKNAFETFYGMRRTTYRIDDSIRALREYADVCPECSLEVDSIITGLNEYKKMFKGGQSGEALPK